MKASSLFAACMVALAALSPSPLAQAKPAAVVEFAGGEDFVVIRAGRKVSFQDPIGLELYQGDQLQTGDGVFIELRLLSQKAVLKLAENTTFVLERVADGQTALQLVYGRVRAKVEKVAGTESFTVRSAQAIAGVRGTDFGLDVVASRQAAAAVATTNAYCFEGAVEVTAFVRSDALAAEALEAIPKSFVIGTGEMLRVEGAAGKAEATKAAIEPAIRAFWTANDYESSKKEPEVKVPAPPTPSAEELAAAREKELRDAAYASGFDAAKAEFYKGPDWVPPGFVSEAELEALRLKARVQKAGLMAGGLFGLAGAGLSAAGYYYSGAGDEALGSSLMAAGMVIGAASLPFLVLSIAAGP